MILKSSKYGEAILTPENPEEFTSIIKRPAKEASVNEVASVDKTFNSVCNIVHSYISAGYMLLYLFHLFLEKMRELQPKASPFRVEEVVKCPYCGFKSKFKLLKS